MLVEIEIWIEVNFCSIQNKDVVKELLAIPSVFKLSSTAMLFCRSCQSHGNIDVLNVAERSDEYHGYSSKNKIWKTCMCEKQSLFEMWNRERKKYAGFEMRNRDLKQVFNISEGKNTDTF